MIILVALGLFGATLPEENYGFLSVTDGPCVSKADVDTGIVNREECRRMTEPKRYRGTWYVAFETSVFTPRGMRNCIEAKAPSTCARLAGAGLPWPSRWACPRAYEVEFIGRHNTLAGVDPVYRIVVDELISAKRLPDPQHESGECDEAAR